MTKFSVFFSYSSIAVLAMAASAVMIKIEIGMNIILLLRVVTACIPHRKFPCAGVLYAQAIERV